MALIRTYVGESHSNATKKSSAALAAGGARTAARRSSTRRSRADRRTGTPPPRGAPGRFGARSASQNEKRLVSSQMVPSLIRNEPTLPSGLAIAATSCLRVPTFCTFNWSDALIFLVKGNL